MQNVSVSTYTLALRELRKKEIVPLWNTPISNGSDKKISVLELLADKIKDEKKFNLNKCYRRKSQQEELVQKNASNEDDVPIPNGEKIKLTSFGVPPIQDHQEEDKVLHGIVQGSSGENLFEYLFFTISYGKNGIHSTVDKESGEHFEVTTEDYTNHIHHVFIARNCDEHVSDAIMIVENVGHYSIANPMKRLLKKLLKEIDGKKYSLDVYPFVDKRIIEAFIKNKNWAKICVAKRIKNEENYAWAEYEYEEKEIVFRKPKGKLKEYVLSKIPGYRSAQNSETSLETNEDIEEIENFNPDEITFEVGEEGQRKTFTIGKEMTGIMREVLKDALGADGLSKDDVLLVECQRIFKENHLSEGV